MANLHLEQFLSMTWILGIGFLTTAAALGLWRYRNDPECLKGVVVLLLCMWWPAAGVCPFFREARNPILLLLALISLSWSNRSGKRSHPLLPPTVLALVLLMALSLLWALNPKDSLLRVAAFALAFLVLVRLRATTDPQQVVKWLSDGLLFAAYATVVLALYGSRSAEGIGPDGRLRLTDGLRATGAAALCLWGLLRFLAEAIRRPGWRRPLHLALALILLLTMVRTGTRATLVELALAGPLLLATCCSTESLWRATRRFGVYLGATAVSLALFWTHLDKSQRAQYQLLFRFDEDGEFQDSRTPLWQTVLSKALHRPWLGRGFGSSSFYELSDEEYSDVQSTVVGFRTTVHNQYLEVFYEFGGVGLAVFIWVVLVLARGALRLLASAGENGRTWSLLAIYALIGITEGLTHGGQLSTGQQDLLRRWMLYLCILCGPAVVQVKGQLRPGRRAAFQRGGSASLRHSNRPTLWAQRGSSRSKKACLLGGVPPTPNQPNSLPRSRPAHLTAAFPRES